ncbi:MAG: VCBS repeat-containing protein [Nodosilinea sp.]
MTWSNIDGATGVNFSPRNGQVNQFLQVAVSYLDGQGTAESLTSEPTSESVAKFGATSDFNSDGSADIVWRHQTSGESVFWLMDNIDFAGSDVLSPVVSDVNWDIKALGDLNGDGKADLVWQNKVTNQAAVWLMDGLDFTSGELLPNIAAPGWTVVETGDFNSNGKDDLLWRNANTGELAVWFMNGTNFVSGELITLNAGLDWGVGAVGDFTNDGKVDIFWENRITGANAFWKMDGTTFVEAYGTTAAAAEWKAKGATDFNQDGNLDLLWHNPGTGENALWIMDGTDFVEGVTTLPTTPVDWNPVV